MLNNRRQARELALRAFYAHELSGNELDDVVDEMIKNGDHDEMTRTFAERLLRASVLNKQKLEELITKQAHNWDFSRIAILDKLVMRICVCEFIYFEDIPPKVSIDEAIEISKKYSTEKSNLFINGILDGILNYLMNKDLIKKTGRGLG